MMHDEHPVIGSVFVITDVYLIGIHVSQIHFFAAFFRNPCGENHIDPRFFDAVDECADALDVRGMGGYAAREVLEFVPLL